MKETGSCLACTEFAYMLNTLETTIEWFTADAEIVFLYKSP